MQQRRKLYFGLALAALLTVGFVATSLISYFVAHDSLTDRIAEESLPLTSDNIYSEIQRDLLRPILISSVMAHDTFVRDWAIAGENDPERIIQYLREIQAKYGTITAFFVSEKTRHYYHPTGILKTVSRDDPGDAWYFRVRGMNEAYEVNVDADTANRERLSIFINYRVYDYDGDYIGATGVGLSVNAVTRLIEAYQRRYGRRIYFIDREGDVTLHGSGFEGAFRIQERPGLAQHATQILTSPSMSLTYTRPDGHTVFVNSRLVPEFDWYLLVEQTESPAEARIQKTLVVNLLVALGITILVLLVAHFTVRGYQRRLEEMATTDKLTGAANRQVFDMIFDHEIKTARRRGNEPVCVVSIDIDHFKHINDTYGHQGGDTVLREIAAVIREYIRESDTLCRWGGEEFLVLLGDCSLAAARERAETIRNAVKNHPIRFGRDDIFVTVSLGVAQHRASEDLTSLIHRADMAMYEAKREGRDRVRQ
ncbi:putative two-component response regulator and GGDEF family protein YeaJ [Salinisphaera sp. PC39]|uniref:sensor domain-containing diguanylate cyclase n=1 Tax=Salinisphaera sp. PC39 TaxID=1304156 RepID=UPI00333FB844